jgi:hypothetical protein
VIARLLYRLLRPVFDIHEARRADELARVLHRSAAEVRAAINQIRDEKPKGSA